jgi:hypothetical protein
MRAQTYAKMGIRQKCEPVAPFGLSHEGRTAGGSQQAEDDAPGDIQQEKAIIALPDQADAFV